MKVYVHDDRCKGHGACCGLCPDLFELTDAGYAVTRMSEVPKEYDRLVRRAADQCPEHAISIAE